MVNKKELQKLLDDLYKVEPKRDLLHDLTGLAISYESLTMTTDGHILGRPKGSVGYDAYIGSPNLTPTVIKRAVSELEKLPMESKRVLSEILQAYYPQVYSKMVSNRIKT